MGGAIVPVIIVRIGDAIGLRDGLSFFLIFGCVLSLGSWAKPLITNATLNLKKGRSPIGHLTHCVGASLDKSVARLEPATHALKALMR